MASRSNGHMHNYSDELRKTLEMIIKDGKGPQPKPNPKPKDYHRENLKFIKELQAANQSKKIQSKNNTSSAVVLKSTQMVSSRYSSAIGHQGKLETSVIPHPLGYVPPYVNEHKVETIEKTDSWYKLDERKALQTLDNLTKRKKKFVNKLGGQLTVLKCCHDIQKEKKILEEMLDTIEGAVLMFIDPKVELARRYIAGHKLCCMEQKPSLLPPHPLGYIPSYVIDWKKMANIPPGCTLLSSEERLLTYELLLKVKEELLKILDVLQHFRNPHTVENEKKEFEKKLAKVEEGIAIFSFPRVIVQEDI